MRRVLGEPQQACTVMDRGSKRRERRRHGERPCGLISRYGSAGELRAWRPILWDTRPLMGVFRGITPGL